MNSESNGWTKTIFYNVVVFIVIASVLYWIIPVGGAISRFYKQSYIEAWLRKIPASYEASDANWVRRHWIEINRSGDVYKSYVGWRHALFRGETINVEGRYLQRRTINDRASDEKKAYFFGGSAMWGFGSPDAATIPSQFAALTGIRAENFAENGWVAHQNLMLLIQLIQSGHRPDLVVFYDGVNDALEKCRSELPPEAHQRERELDTLMRNSLRTDSFSHFLAPVVSLAQRINAKLNLMEVEAWYECDRNAAKAEAIAENLISDWQLAKHLVERYGGKFVGILQPVTSFSQTRLDHLKLSAYVKQQYQAVYPLIRQKIARGGEFYDLVPIFDRDEYLYIDWCHVTPKGNRYAAEKIAELVGPLGFKR